MHGNWFDISRRTEKKEKKHWCGVKQKHNRGGFRGVEGVAIPPPPKPLENSNMPEMHCIGLILQREF